MKAARLALVAAFLVPGPLFTGSAQAAPTCTWDPMTRTLSVLVDEDGGGLRVEGTQILLNSSVCDAGATTSTVNTIEVTAGSMPTSFGLNLFEGEFAPGEEVEATGASEIEISVDLGPGRDELDLISADAVQWSLGSAGVNLNADDDVDVSLAGVDRLNTWTDIGVDTISAAGDGVVGSAFPGRLFANSGGQDDTLIGGANDDWLEGGDGNDLLEGGVGADVLAGELGDDSIVGGPGIDRANYIYGDSHGPVTVNLLERKASGGQGTDSVVQMEDIIGTISYADHLTGSNGPNRINGWGGKDVIDGRGGPDVLLGGVGFDRVTYAGSPNPVRASLSTGHASGWGRDRLIAFEDVTGSRWDDRLTGNGRSNELFGGRGDDLIEGLPGDDEIRGVRGRDTVVGGSGDDLIGGGAARDILRGGYGGDVLSGGIGPDLLRGEAGNDSLIGGLGRDTCYQGAGLGPRISCEEPVPV